jgi:hypothetical protein
MIYDLDVWDSNGLLKIYANIKPNLKQEDIIILNAVHEFKYNSLYGNTENILDLIDLVKQRNAMLHMITCSHESFRLLEPTSNLRIHFWPEYWATLTFYRLLVPHNYNPNLALGLNPEHLETGKNFPYYKYPFISMNNRPKNHRAIMMDMLAKHDLIDKNAVIWRELSNQYQFRHWKQEILLLDQLEKFESQERVPTEYVFSMMQLVPESSEEVFIFSEKTAMPLFFNKPFIVAGCVGYHKILQEMGFKLYDELFDYSFDSEPDILTRYEMIAENLKRHVGKSPKELKQLYDSVFEKCMYNKRIVLRLATDSSLIPEIYTTLVQYQEQNNLESLPSAINNFIKTKENDYRLQ